VFGEHLSAVRIDLDLADAFHARPFEAEIHPADACEE